MFCPEFVKTRVPKERIDGTQIPTNIPCILFPLNQRETDRRNEIKAASIKILIPEVKEAGEGAIVPSSSLITQAAIGSSLVISVMQYKKHGIKVFRKLHPGGTLSKKLLSLQHFMEQ